MKNSIFISIVALVATFSACKEETSSTAEVGFYIPDGFPQPVYTFDGNEITPEGFELGRRLFYDPVLSIDSTVSCGSCHQQFVAFAQADHKVSHGVFNQNGSRNSPVLFNLAWQKAFFWDGGANHIEVQPIGPITNPVEMGESLSHVIMKLKRSTYYPGQFRKAFGADTITSQGIQRALAQFMGALISADTHYDRYRSGKETFTDAEKRGLDVFRAKCNNCHTEPLFTDNEYHNNGLDFVFTRDPGRARITLLPTDSGKFKVPSLRNVALSYPYMHDGRISNLSSVIEHYRSGIRQSATLDSLLTGGVSMTNQEKDDLLIFLNTLTDYTLIGDRRFSEKQ